MAEYNEILCQAIDTIVKERLAQIKFDETISCVIVDNTERKKGKYRVQYGSITFDAYGENTTYDINTTVYVLIPKGDYSQKKIIICKII